MKSLAEKGLLTGITKYFHDNGTFINATNPITDEIFYLPNSNGYSNYGCTVEVKIFKPF